MEYLTVLKVAMLKTILTPNPFNMNTVQVTTKLPKPYLPHTLTKIWHSCEQNWIKLNKENIFLKHHLQFNSKD